MWAVPSVAYGLSRCCDSLLGLPSSIAVQHCLLIMTWQEARLVQKLLQWQACIENSSLQVPLWCFMFCRCLHVVLPKAVSSAMIKLLGEPNPSITALLFVE